MLYVEDDEVNVLLMEHLFAVSTNWQLECARSGAEGMAAATRRCHQLILLDMSLPDITGIELFRRLQADLRTKHIPCIAVSGEAAPTQINRALALGFTDYWVKPLDLRQAIAKMKRLLKQEPLSVSLREGSIQGVD